MTPPYHGKKLNVYIYWDGMDMPMDMCRYASKAQTGEKKLIHVDY